MSTDAKENSADSRKKLDIFIEYLNTKRVLLVLDGWEVLHRENYPADVYRNNYELYGEFIQKIGECKHQSCLLVTTREEPPEIDFLEGESAPIRRYKLLGLNETDALKILAEETKAQESKWRQLIRHYGGNPLAIKIIYNTIKDVFNGNVAEFLIQETLFLGNMSRVLEQQFERLSNLEKEVLRQLVIIKEPVAFSRFTSEIFPTVTASKIIEAIDSLKSRSLIEMSSDHNSSFYSLQPMVKKYVTNHFNQHNSW